MPCGWVCGEWELPVRWSLGLESRKFASGQVLVEGYYLESVSRVSH